LHPQFTLPFETAPSSTFDSFHEDDGNRLAYDAVKGFVDSSLEETQLYLWGQTGCGKTHLLSAACQWLTEHGYRVAYLPGELANQSEALAGLENLELVCFDDLQRLDRAAEVELFHCINRCRSTGSRLLFAADRTPDELGLVLSDLLTRLSWGPRFQLLSLSDDALGTGLRNEIEARSLQATDEVISYILKRFPRNMAALKAVVDQLDKASLSEQRRITVPLVKQVFA